MKIHATVTGQKQLNAQIERTIVRVRREAKKIVLAEAESIIKESLLEVPRETNALAESAYVYQADNGDVEFGYGGPNVQTNPKTQHLTDEYMVAVHEDLTKRHNVGKAKFLEDPVRRHSETLLDKIAKKFKSIFS